jgi:hypothetical protein
MSVFLIWLVVLLHGRVQNCQRKERMVAKRVGIVFTVVVGLLLVFLAALSFPAVAEEYAGEAAPIAAADAAQAVEAAFTQLPLYFVENQGQLDEQVAYYLQGKDKTLYFTPEGLTFALSGSAHEDTAGGVQRWILKLDFVGANRDVQPVGVSETGALISYFKGRPEQWKTGLKTYSSIVYRDLWPGIDLEYSGTVNRLKYQFVVHPGADPAQIRLAYRGADLVIDDAGQLLVSTPLASFHDGTPYAYQEAEGGQRVTVEASYQFPPTRTEAGIYGFHVGDYDPARPVVLDPVVFVYCGFIGGSTVSTGQEAGYEIAVDGDGNAYVTGQTYSTEAEVFPVTVGPDVTHNGAGDAFVAKVISEGTGLEYCGYIGGASYDVGLGIAVDASGAAYAVGRTDSDESEGFPAIVGPDLTHNGGTDAFVAKVTADGTDLEYCGYIGGSGREWGKGIAVDGSGNAYVCGETQSGEATFPDTVGPDVTYNGGNSDAFVAKVRADGTALDYCGYIGGSSDDKGEGIAVDAQGRAYVAGSAWSTEGQFFPVTVGPDVAHNGKMDAFVAKVLPGGTGLVYCGFIGGSENEQGYEIAVDGDGHAYVTGYTYSSEAQVFPVTVGPDLTYNSAGDAFVAKVEADGTALAYCGYIGGSEREDARGIDVDGQGNAYVVGVTLSTPAQGFPVIGGPQLTYSGEQDVFVSKVRADGTALLHSGYIGGSQYDSGEGIAVDAAGHAYVVGYTESHQDHGFPVTVGPDVTHNSGTDAFVAKIFFESHKPTLGAVVPASGSGQAGVATAFITSWSDEDGWRDLKQCYFHIGAGTSLAGNVTLYYHLQKNKLRLRTDDGAGWTAACEPGSANFLENSQARVDCSLTTVQGSADTLVVAWAIEFKPGYSGDKKLGLLCKDILGEKARAAWKGTWTIIE